MSRAASLLLLTCLQVSLFAQAPEAPGVEVSTSLVAGQSFELVLRDGTYTNPISRLTWDTPFSMALSLKASLRWTSWTTTAVELGGLAPLQVGHLVDEDWDTGSLSYGKSTHGAYSMADWWAGAEQQLRFGGVSMGAGLLYRWMSWEGWNGEGTYRYLSGSEQTVTFSGLMIAYRQQWILPYVALTGAFELPGVTLVPTVRLSPYTWCNDMDNHKYARDDTTIRDPKDYLDQTRGGWWGQGSVEAAWSGGPGWTWGLRLGGEMAWGAVGDTVTTYSYQSTSGSTPSYATERDSAGTWFYRTSVSLFVRN